MGRSGAESTPLKLPLPFTDVRRQLDTPAVRQSPIQDLKQGFLLLHR